MYDSESGELADATDDQDCDYDAQLHQFEEWKLIDLTCVSNRTKAKITTLEEQIRDKDCTRKQRRNLQGQRNRLKAIIVAR